MALNAIGQTTRLRMLGINSGLDVEGIVNSMLQVNKLKIDNLYKSYKAYEWKVEAYRDVNKAFQDFSATFTSAAGKSTINSASAIKTFAINKTGDTSAFTVTSTSNSVAGITTIDKVSQIATAATAQGTRVTEDGTSLDLKAKLSEAGFENDPDFPENNGTYDYGSFSINGYTFTVGDLTVEQLMTTINNSAAGVKMSFDKATQQFKIESKKTGADQTVEIENISGNFFGTATGTGMYDDDGNEIIEYDDSVFGISEGTFENGKNAKFTINGVDIEQASNTYEHEGTSITFKTVTDTKSTFELTQDLDAAVKRITEFVDGYNALLEKINGLLSETKYPDFTPLTDEEQASLSETVAKQYEEKARSGILKNDATISSLVSKMRLIMVGAKAGDGTTLSAIGIKGKDYSEKGKLHIDETKLREALSENPDAVAEIFSGEGGLAAQITSEITSLNSKLYSTVFSKVVDKQKAYDKQNAELERRYAADEEKYYAMYTAMETAMTEANNMSSWLSQQLGTS